MSEGPETPTLAGLREPEVIIVAEVAEASSFYERQFLHFLKERLLDVRNERTSYKVVLGVLVAQMLAASAFLAFAGQITPRVVVGNAGGATATIALPIYLFVVGSFAGGWMLVLDAALRMPIGARLATSLFSVALLGVVPVQQIFAIAGRTGDPYKTEMPLRITQVSLLIVVGVWMASRAIGLWQNELAVVRRWQQSVASGVIILLIAGYYLADLVITRAYALHAGAGGVPVSALGIQMQFLPFLFTIIVYVGSTNFIEWAQTLAQYLSTAAYRFRFHGLFFAIIAAFAIGNILDLHRVVAWGDLLPATATSLILFGAIALVAWYARIDVHWPDQVPLSALLTGVGFIYLFFQVIAAIADPTTNNKLYTILSVSATVVYLAVALGIINYGRRRTRSDLRAIGLYLASMALLLLSFSVPQTANVLGLPVIPATQATVPAFRFIVSVGTLVTLLWLAVTNNLRRALIAPLSYRLVLFAGLQVISIFLLFIDPTLSSGATASVVLAVLLFVVALLWDLITSGDVTNRDSTAFPRAARFLFYVGYTIIGVATLIYLKSQRIGASVVPGGDDMVLEQYGAMVLGLPIIAYAFIRSIGAWHSVMREKQEHAAVNVVLQQNPAPKRDLPPIIAFFFCLIILLTACSSKSIATAATATATTDIATDTPTATQILNTPTAPPPTATPRPPTPRPPTPKPTPKPISVINALNIQDYGSVTLSFCQKDVQTILAVVSQTSNPKDEQGHVLPLLFLNLYFDPSNNGHEGSLLRSFGQALSGTFPVQNFVGDSLILDGGMNVYTTGNSGSYSFNPQVRSTEDQINLANISHC